MEIAGFKFVETQNIDLKKLKKKLNSINQNRKTKVMSNGSDENTASDEDDSQPSEITLTHNGRDSAIKGESVLGAGVDDDEADLKKKKASELEAKKKTEEHANERNRILRESINSKPGNNGGMGDI